VLAKALHGVIPRLVGLPLDRARRKLDRLHVDVEVSPDDAPDSARVVAQKPRPGRAAAPGMKVRLVAKRG
jgi:beta-lactam-binding protein with PASTA domain